MGVAAGTGTEATGAGATPREGAPAKAPVAGTSGWVGASFEGAPEPGTNGTEGDAPAGLTPASGTEGGDGGLGAPETGTVGRESVGGGGIGPVPPTFGGAGMPSAGAATVGAATTGAGAAETASAEFVEPLGDATATEGARGIGDAGTAPGIEGADTTAGGRAGILTDEGAPAIGTPEPATATGDVIGAGAGATAGALGIPAETGAGGAVGAKEGAAGRATTGPPDKPTVAVGIETLPGATGTPEPGANAEVFVPTNLTVACLAGTASAGTTCATVNLTVSRFAEITEGFGGNVMRMVCELAPEPESGEGEAVSDISASNHQREEGSRVRDGI